MINPGEKIVIPSQNRNLVAGRASRFAAGLHGSAAKTPDPSHILMFKKR
jgi:hypothetical protein